MPAAQQTDIAGQWAVSWSFVDCANQRASSDSTQASSESELQAQDVNLPGDRGPMPEAASTTAAAAVAGEARVVERDVQPALLSTDDVAVLRRLSWAHADAFADFAEALPSAEWLEAAASSSAEQQASHDRKVRRRSLIAQNGKPQRHVSLRGLLHAASLRCCD